MAKYRVNDAGVAKAKALIDARQYVVRSWWAEVQPSADEDDSFLEYHTWVVFGELYLALSERAREETKARYGFVFGDFRRLHRMGLIACHYRAAEWDHKEIELAAHDLLQYLDKQRQRSRK